jgi:protein SCO1/2
MRVAIWLAFVAVILTASAVRAEDGLPPLLRGVRIDQRLGERVPLDLVFRDEAGHPVQLGDYFHDKPVILVLAYYRCPRLCTQVLNGLLDSLNGLPAFDVGDKFDVLTVSFDPRETPELARAKKQAYVESYGRPGAAEGWHFLTGEQASIERLTEAVGFYYEYDPRTDQFAHASGIMVLTPKGEIARYFYGINYPPRDLRLALVEASGNKIGSPVDQLLLFCFHYDPATGKYTATVMNLVRVTGILTVLTLGAVFAITWQRERRKARANLLSAG